MKAVWTLLLCCACFSSMALDQIEQRDLTVKTPWGPVGLYAISYTDSAGTTEVGQNGFLQLCAGPFGSVTVTTNKARAAAQQRAAAPILFAAAIFGYVVWANRRGANPAREPQPDPAQHAL